MWNALKYSLARFDPNLCRLVFSYAVDVAEFLKYHKADRWTKEMLVELWQLYQHQGNERYQQRRMLLCALESPFVMEFLPVLVCLPAQISWQQVLLGVHVQLSTNLAPHQFDEIGRLLGRDISCYSHSLLRRAIHIGNWKLVRHLLEKCESNEYAVWALFVHAVGQDMTLLDDFLVQYFGDWCGCELARDGLSIRLCFLSEECRRDFFRTLRRLKLQTVIRHRTLG